ncbi:proline dehydrogenase [Frankia sp. CcI49]|nr:proline dehydrogenase [Frankia sp. CcI49]
MSRQSRSSFGGGPMDALARAALAADDRILATIDRLGPAAADSTAADAATRAYLTLLDLADRAGIAEDLDICLRLPAIGREIPHDGEKRARDNAAEICARARAVGATVTLATDGDIDDPASVDEVLAALADLRRAAPTTGVTLRADLRRTPADCRELARSGARVRLRLRPGWHLVRRSVATADPAFHDQRRGFAACLGILMAGPGYPMIATQDPRLMALTTRLAARAGRHPDSFEFQTVRGTPRREHRRLAATGYRARIYVSYRR